MTDRVVTLAKALKKRIVILNRNTFSDNNHGGGTSEEDGKSNIDSGSEDGLEPSDNQEDSDDSHSNSLPKKQEPKSAQGGRPN